MTTNHEQRAYLAWPHLVHCAGQGSTITYGDLAKAIGVHHRAIRFVLGVIQDYCLDNKLPPLTVLVVNQTSGQPGHGFIAWDVDDLSTGYQMVYGFNWGQISNPFEYSSSGDTIETIVAELIEQPDKSEEIYGKVKARGTGQTVFRKALLEIYKGRCAFCGLTFEDVLEASHIIPWSASNAAQKIHPSNGVLLCSTRIFH